MKKPLSKKAKARKAQILKRRAAKPRKPHAPKTSLRDKKHARPAHGEGPDHAAAVPRLAEWPARAAFASIVLHVPGKSHGRALCGADEPGIPMGDPAMFGPLLERLEVAKAVAGELAAAFLMVGEAGLGTFAIEICKGCDANLQRMIMGDAKKLEAFRGRPSEGQESRTA